MTNNFIAELQKAMRGSLIAQPIYYFLRAAKRFTREFAAFTGSFFFVARKIIPLIIRCRQRPVLFNRWLGAGDMICTFPAALKIKGRHPDAVFIYNCHPDFASLPPMAGVATLTSATRIVPVVKYWSFLFQGVYDFRAAEDGKNFYVSDIFPIEFFGRQHGVNGLTEHPRLTVPALIVQRTDALLSRLALAPNSPMIVFHTGPTWAIREWPLASWCALIAALQSAGFRNLIRVGASKNAFMGEQVADVVPGVISLVDQLSLDETIGLIARADLLIGIDSGLLHMAAAVQTPFVGIWGPTTPNRRFSERAAHQPVVSREPCQGCHHRLPCLHWITGCQYDIRCMKNILPEEVLAASLQQLKTAKRIS